jgi:hypothetical protein
MADNSEFITKLIGFGLSEKEAQWCLDTSHRNAEWCRDSTSD